MDPERGSAAPIQQSGVATALIGDASDRHPKSGTDLGSTPPVSPCCGRDCCGGPARVWCPSCGHSYQADELQLTGDPRIQPAA